MGGIGKTTLAKNIYDNSFVREHFQVRAWVTVSQEYNVREIILRLLHDINVSIGQNMQESRKNLVAFIDGMSRMSDYQLENSYTKVCGAGDNSNGSRILVTTRLSNVAEQCGSCNIFPMSFLDADESWELFCRHVFGEEDHCPPELEKIGKRIVKKCRGLPLAIIVVGGLLSKSDKTQEYWEQIAEDITAVINCDKDDLEEVAEEYLEDLIDRNLILPFRAGVDGNLKGCRMHDLLRDLCLREARKQNFFSVTRIYSHPNAPGTESERRLILHQHPRKNEYSPRDNNVLRSAPLARSLVCSVKCFPSQLTSKFRLLRVLDTVDELSVADILQLVNSRYLAFRINMHLHAAVPSSISQLRNLQTLIVESSTSTPVLLPTVVWEMPQLRHLKFRSVCLPDPPIAQRDLDFPHSLKKLILLSCRFPWEDITIIGSLPNLEVLILREDAFDGEKWEPNEGEFPQLKFLFISSSNLEYWHAESTHFPKLENLVLHGCLKLKEIPSDIGEIPTLESISLCLCSSSAVVSAKEILMEQRSLGNDDFFRSSGAQKAGTLPEAEMQNLLEDPPKPWDVEVGSSQIFML
ncbi:putative late blight resistance proteinR1B-16 [Sesamum angolense]|uniref:Late blight resistance proteinR1B-16 n=1 Tax=Sesamum angolense TaxID=2727404 RepID=A0AAE1T3X5_9LAMI|nr:putative late blight resistance proteinR1B-16 [Sesamum angolense]